MDVKTCEIAKLHENLSGLQMVGFYNDICEGHIIKNINMLLE